MRRWNPTPVHEKRVRGGGRRTGGCVGHRSAGFWAVGHRVAGPRTVGSRVVGPRTAGSRVGRREAGSLPVGGQPPGGPGWRLPARGRTVLRLLPSVLGGG